MSLGSAMCGGVRGVGCPVFGGLFSTLVGRPPLHVFFNNARSDGPKNSERRLEAEEEVRQIESLQGGAVWRFGGEALRWL